MKNKYMKKTYYIIFLLLFVVCKTSSANEINFDTAKIEISNNGNTITALDGEAISITDKIKIKGEKFVYEKTKCSSGKFSEFIRSRGDSLRSDHPVFSVSAIGKNKKYICSKNSLHNYGYGSPYHKFLKLNGKILNLAMEPCFNPLLHYAEFLVGVPYYYNKLTKLRYYKKGKKINKSFSSYVRYLNLDIKRNLNTFKKINHILRKNKIVKSTNLGSSKIHLIDSQKYLDVILDILYNDQFALVDNLTFLKNQIPNK